MENEVAIYGVNDLQVMAQAMASTGMFGFKKKEEAFALMLIAQAEGKHPATIAQDYDIIQGRPALKSVAVLSRFQHAGGSIQWHFRTDEGASATFSHKLGGDVTITWDKARAEKALLWGKDMWKKVPAQMFSARVVSEGVRACFPACLNGFYVAEEAMDFEPKKGGQQSHPPRVEVSQVPPDESPGALEEISAIIADIVTAARPLPKESHAHIQADIDAAGNDLDALAGILEVVRESVERRDLETKALAGVSEGERPALSKWLAGGSQGKPPLQKIRDLIAKQPKPTTTEEN
jgi:hypothetical protein